ncbi:RNase H domain-containing protein [Trichonephila clavipes]|nr:RNase H domain-containing protein [Trichonephila clavipes]
MFSHLSQPAWTEPKRNQQGRQTPELRKRGGREDVFVCSGPLLMKVDHNKQIKETIIEAFLRELRKSECFIGHFPPFEKSLAKFKMQQCHTLPTILEGLNSIESLPQLHNIWIFSDSRSAIQHLANWHNVRDRTGTGILKILKRLFLSREIHFQGIPSHVNIAGNEIVDSLARAGAGETTTPAAPLTYLELFSKYKAKNKAIWMIPPVHPWYQSKYSGGSLVRGSSRRDPTALTRFLSGHLMS